MSAKFKPIKNICLQLKYPGAKLQSIWDIILLTFDCVHIESTSCEKNIFQ